MVTVYLLFSALCLLMGAPWFRERHFVRGTQARGIPPGFDGFFEGTTMILRFLAGLFDGHCKAEFWRMARELPVTQGVLASELFDKALDGTLRVTGQAGRLEFETEFGKGRMTKEYLDDGVRYSLDVPTFPPFSALFDARMEATVECSALVRLWDQLQVAATRRDLKLAA